MAEEIVVNLEKKKWWQKQRFWAAVLGVASYACTLIPGAQVAVAPLGVAAGLLGWKGFSDQGDRVENIVKAEARATLDAPPC